MKNGSWLVAAGIVLASLGAEAAPLPIGKPVPMGAVPVQFYGNEEVLRYHATPSYGQYSRDGYPDRYRRQDQYGRSGRDYQYDREIAREQERLRREWAEQQERRRIQFEKEAIRDQRRQAKEDQKDRIRAWNRANGF